MEAIVKDGTNNREHVLTGNIITEWAKTDHKLFSWGKYHLNFLTQKASSVVSEEYCGKYYTY